MFGMKIKNPSDIIIKVKNEITLIFEIISDFQKINAARGDKNKSMEGIPNNPCNLCGYENNPAPNIENEKVQSIKMGIIFSPFFLQILKSPILKNMLKIEVSKSPIVKIYCVSVPISPNSLTILIA